MHMLIVHNASFPMAHVPSYPVPKLPAAEQILGFGPPPLTREHIFIIGDLNFFCHPPAEGNLNHGMYTQAASDACHMCSWLPKIQPAGHSVHRQGGNVYTPMKHAHKYILTLQNSCCVDSERSVIHISQCGTLCGMQQAYGPACTSAAGRPYPIGASHQTQTLSIQIPWPHLYPFAHCWFLSYPAHCRARARISHQNNCNQLPLAISNAPAAPPPTSAVVPDVHSARDPLPDASVAGGEGACSLSSLARSCVT